MKRYFFGLRLSALSHGLLHFLLAVALATLALLAVRTCWLMQVAVTADRPDLGLFCGDRIIVNRWAWGGRQAFPALFEPSEEWLSNSLGELVVYRHPSEPSGLCIGRVNAPSGGQYIYKGRRSQPMSCIVDGQDVRCDLIVGRVECVSYSLDSTKTFFRQLRSERLFLDLP